MFPTFNFSVWKVKCCCFENRVYNFCSTEWLILDVAFVLWHFSLCFMSKVLISKNIIYFIKQLTDTRQRNYFNKNKSNLSGQVWRFYSVIPYNSSRALRTKCTLYQYLQCTFKIVAYQNVGFRLKTPQLQIEIV